jgi:hypothetical protein
MRSQRSRQLERSGYDGARNALTTEKLSEFLHPALHQVLLAEVLAQGHIGQLRLLFLYFEQARFNGILNDQPDSGDWSCLTETMLWHSVSPDKSPF